MEERKQHIIKTLDIKYVNGGGMIMGLKCTTVIPPSLGAAEIIVNF